MRRLLPLLLLTLVTTAFGDEPQVWESRDGQTFTGDFLAIRPGKVYVRGKDKKIVAIPMAKLTDACLAEAAYLQAKLGAWAKAQVERKAMNEATAWAVLMLEPQALSGKSFLVEATFGEAVPGEKNRPAKGPKVGFRTDWGIECQADFTGHGELVVKPDAVYGDIPAGAPADEVSSRNATMLLGPRQVVYVQAKANGGKIVGGLTVTPEEFAKGREADGAAAVEYEKEITLQRIAVMEEQIRTGMSVKPGVEIPGADGKALVLSSHKFSEEELAAIKAELAWLQGKKTGEFLPSR
ncbi:hypothetical protein [Haloferula sp. BvORR071]|uniref:hypothetical protein n=1 Tax=Haloferula sp. BvORR071 TaxID=1396141 RepID=UPI000555AEF5|nr:hypothetical protein [Haloferula sp. BvORR071]